MSNFELKTYQNLIKALSKLASEDCNKDVTFVFEGCDTKIKAHKSILEVASSVFKVMFSGKFSEMEEVKITEISPEVFQLLLKYVCVVYIVST